jgi:hypothetical protein
VLERLLLYWSGEWEQAEAAWSAARDRDQRAGDRLDGALNAYWLGRVRRLLGAAEAAEAALGDGLAVALEGPQVPAEAMLRAELAILGVETGRLQAARAQLARCQEILRAGEDWRGRAGRVAVAAGLVAAADGRPEEAAAALTAAVSSFRAHALPWEEGEALRLWGRTARASDRHVDAVDLYRRLGAGSRWLAWAAG